MRRILVAIGSRANWSSLQSVCEAIDAHPELHLGIVCFASAVVDRYGYCAKDIRKQFDCVHEVATLVEGEHQAMVQTCSLTMASLGALYAQMKPDVVVVCGDRYEVLPAAYAAALQNIRVAHTMGGERSGSIDESIRDAVTKLAHLHLVATENAAKAVESSGEKGDRVHRVGCPRVDVVRSAIGADIHRDSFGDCVVVSLHPVTTEPEATTDAVLRAAHSLGKEVHIIAPNSDAGRDAITYAYRHSQWPLRMHRSLPPDRFARVLRDCALLIGNSSAGIRDASYIGTPVVNVGSRQWGRECAGNVEHWDPGEGFQTLLQRCERQVEHGRYPRSELYGDGHAGKRIAEILAGELPEVQK